jgi:Flp pilus assembly protein CpaB
MILLGVALALVAGWGAFMLAQSGQGPTQVIEESVLVAARDIPARTPITADDVTVRLVPIDEILPQSYTSATDVIGRVTAINVYTDQQITPNLFATSAAGAEFSILGPDEEVTEDSPFWRAVAVSVPNERAVGGSLEAGQHVDLFVSVDIQVLAQNPETGLFEVITTATEDRLASGKSTKITFQDLEVLKADPDTSLYTLKVSLKQAEEIYHVNQLAPDSFSLAMRPEEDTRIADTTEYGETTDRLIMTYLYPVPQLIDLTQLLGPPHPGGEGFPVPVLPTPGPDASPTPEPEASPEPSPAP